MLQYIGRIDSFECAVSEGNGQAIKPVHWMIPPGFVITGRDIYSRDFTSPGRNDLCLKAASSPYFQDMQTWSKPFSYRFHLSSAQFFQMTQCGFVGMQVSFH